MSSSSSCQKVFAFALISGVPISSCLSHLATNNTQGQSSERHSAPSLSLLAGYTLIMFVIPFDWGGEVALLPRGLVYRYRAIDLGVDSLAIITWAVSDTGDNLSSRRFR